MKRFLVLLWLLTVSAAGPALAQPETGSELIADVRFIGHPRVVDTLPLSDGRIASLGEDGLIILWDRQYRPLSWLRVPMAERLAAPGPGHFVAASRSDLTVVRVDDDGRLSADTSIAADAVVFCADHSLWWWPADETSVTWLRDGIERSFPVLTEAASEAACVTAGEQAAIFWPDANSVHVISTVAGAAELPLSLFRLALRPLPGADDFVLTGVDEQGAVQGVRLSDASFVTVDAASATANVCGHFPDGGLTEECPGEDVLLFQIAALPEQLRAVESKWFADGLLLWGPDGAIEVRHVGALARPPWEIDFIYGRTSVDTLVACGRDLSGPVIVSFAAGDGALEHLIPVAECPRTWWFLESDSPTVRATRLGEIVSEGGAISTPPLGRSAIQFVASPSWEPACGGPAWRINRRDADLIETQGESICARSMSFHPVYSSDGTMTHIAARAGDASGNVEFHVYNFVGELVVSTRWSAGPIADASYPRLVLSDGVLSAISLRPGGTVAWLDGGWSENVVPASPSPTSIHVESDGRLQLGDLRVVGGPDGWAAFTSSALVLPDELLPRVLVGWTDGTWCRGDDPRVAARLRAPFVPVNSSSQE